MHLAFLIVGHTRPEQIARLVRRVGAPGATVLVHLDRRMPVEDVRRVVECSAPVEPVPLRRQTCPWGGYGFVEVAIRGMASLKGLGRPFDYLTVLSGQDYPIKPVADFAARLDERPGTTYLEGRRLPREDWEAEEGGWPRVQRWHLRVRRRHLSLPCRRSMPQGFPACGGSAWWTMSRAAVLEVLETVRERPDLLRFFRHVDISDELFFQTVLLNSLQRDHVVDDNLRYIRWDGHRAQETGSPDLLTSADLESLRRSPAFLARKFDPTADGRVLDRIDEELLGRTPSLEPSS